LEELRFGVEGKKAKGKRGSALTESKIYRLFQEGRGVCKKGTTNNRKKADRAPHLGF